MANKFNKNDIFNMTTAWTLSQNSTCSSKAVGCVITKENRIVSTGYNGTKTGYINCCDNSVLQGWTNDEGELLKDFRLNHREWSNKYEYHAEQNAIDMAVRNTIDIKGSFLYVTISPCVECCKRITNVGIERVFFSEYYDNSDEGWREYLTEFGIIVERISLEDLKKFGYSFVDYNNLIYDKVVEE